jgi:tetratricopeptide (TPR) repeat protein
MPGYFNRPRFVQQSTKKKVGRVLYIFIFLQLLFHGMPAFAQRAKIDSLKKALLSVHDSARIECLNLLSLVYSYLNSDTAKSFATKAYTESLAIHYLPGELMALNNIARIAGHGFHDFLQQEKISLQIIQQYKDGSDIKVLVDAYMNLALALFCQSAFEKSRDACQAVIQLAKKTADKKRSAEALTIIGCISLETGNYERSFDYFNESLGIFRSIDDSYNTAILLAKVGDLYRLAGDHKTALNFYFQSLEYPKGPSLQWHPLVDLGDTYYSLEQFDSTSYEHEKYIQSIKSLTVRSNYIAYPNIRAAEMYIASKEYDKAITLLTEELKTTKTKKEENQQMRLLLDISRAYQGKKNTRMAFFYTKELLQSSQTHKARQYIRDAYRLMYTLYDHQHNIDSAYSYYRKYSDMKDSVAFDDLSRKLAVYTAAKENEKKQAQIELLNNEKMINEQQLQLSKQQLKSESFFKNILIAGVLGLSLLSLIIFRNISLKRKNETNRHEIVKQELIRQELESEKTKAELHQRAVVLEMQALRAQMNPHFIFNSLNSINMFILENNKLQASGYLSKFSKLIRLILQNSQEAVIPLEKELEALQLYLELESLRFEQKFEYKISIAAEVDTGVLKVPPLIIQPYAENAIWHGLMHKKEKGHLDIEVYTENEMLFYRITDDGIGRQKAAELKSKSASAHKSMGMRITKDRLAMLQQQNKTSVTITDLVLSDNRPGGTEVLIEMPVVYD